MSGMKARLPAEVDIQVRMLPMDGARIIRVSGELDALNAAYFQEVLASSLESRPSAVLLDLVHLSYLDAEGVRQLLTWHRGAVKAGMTVETRVKDGSIIQRVLRVTGADTVLAVTPESDVEASRAARRVDTDRRWNRP